MSASTNFSFDAWDTAIAALESGHPIPSTGTTPSGSSTLGSSLLLTPTTTASTGEFQPFTMIGSALARGHGGSGKTFVLFSSHQKSAVCMGVISGTKFCLKEESDTSKCTIASHMKKFVPVEGGLYLKENDLKAWCKPVFDGSKLTEAQRDFLLQQELSRSTWESPFQVLSEDQLPTWLLDSNGKTLWTVKAPMLPAQSVMNLVSPKFSISEGPQLFDMVPSLSYDSSNLPTDASPAAAAQTLQSFNDRFKKIKAKWSLAFGEIESGYLVVINDIRNLQQHLALTMKAVGTPPTGDALDDMMWNRIELLTTQLTLSSHDMNTALSTSASNLAKISDHCDDIHHNLQFLENEFQLNQASATDRISELEKQVAAYDSRFQRLLPLLQGLATRSDPPGCF
jgi:hypothetical protein